MQEEKQAKKAREVYDVLCEMMDEKDLKYQKHEDDLVITFIMSGDDIPMQFIVNIDAKRELVRLVSPIPATFDEDRRLDGAIATGQANYRLADGSFDYDYATGKVFFRMTSSFMDSLISKELFEYMIGCACYSVDAYNDKFLALAKGQTKLEEFFR